MTHPSSPFEIHSELPYDEYLQSPVWKAKRAYLIVQADARCQLCNASGALEIHHRTYERVGREEPGDLVVLCRSCHGRFHDGRGTAALASIGAFEVLHQEPLRKILTVISTLVFGTIGAAMVIWGAILAIPSALGLILSAVGQTEPDTSNGFAALAIGTGVAFFGGFMIKGWILERGKTWYGLPKTPEAWDQWRKDKSSWWH